MVVARDERTQRGTYEGEKKKVGVQGEQGERWASRVARQMRAGLGGRLGRLWRGCARVGGRPVLLDPSAEDGCWVERGRRKPKRSGDCFGENRKTLVWRGQAKKRCRGRQYEEEIAVGEVGRHAEASDVGEKGQRGRTNGRDVCGDDGEVGGGRLWRFPDRSSIRSGQTLSASCG